MLKKILIVDDEESIVTLLSAILGNFKEYVILCARDGIEAIDMVRSEHPDIILLDNRLPDMTGIDVCKSVKSDPELHHTRILMLSCQGQNFDWEKALKTGADGYITKPFDSTVLVEKVKELIRGN